MTENYKDYPKSITELKGERDDSSMTWTPRDALINLLRDIDSGDVQIDHLMILFGECCPEKGNVLDTSFSQGGKFGFYEQLGMLEAAKHAILRS